MRSGLYNYTNAPEVSETILDTGGVLAIAFAHPPNAPPRTAYEYNNN